MLRPLISDLKNNLSLRPHWMNTVMFFCFYMTFIYLPWDIFVKPLADDQEVWFGILFYGWLAKLGGALHWIVYGLFAFGLWGMRSWLHPWIEIYILQVALSMLLWGAFENGGSMSWSALVPGGFFILLAFCFYKNRTLLKF
ncbi:MAG: hypothetical protein P8N40_01335 [Gammaproteobacteria bacterium]|nr:hypothetical protein [Gammaproteobacteria bacterium]